MKKIVLLCLSAILGSLLASQPLRAGQPIQKADDLFEKGSFQGYERAIALYEKVLDEDPDNFEAAWKCARAHQWAGDLAKSRRVDNWKKICVRHGKAGLARAEKAVRLRPERVEGHYYKGCTAAVYADGASVFTVLSKGLLDTIQTGLETAYEIDKRFDHGGVMQALGRLHFALPWPKKDLDKSLAYLRESQRIFPDDPCGQAFLAETLLEADGKQAEEEAVNLLQKAAAPDTDQFSPAVVEIYGGLAEKILEELKRQ